MAKGQTGSTNRKHRRPSNHSGESHGRSSRTSWYARNRSDIRFLVIFVLVIGAYYAATVTSPVKNGFFPAYLRLNAAVSGALLRAVGQDVTVNGQAISSANGPSIQIARGCDAVDPSALFVAAVLASPVRIGAKLLAAGVGTVLLMLLNFLRVASLFLVRVYYPKAFDVIHLDVWQALFIFMAILMWGLWASRVSNQPIERAAAA